MVRYFGPNALRATYNVLQGNFPRNHTIMQGWEPVMYIGGGKEGQGRGNQKVS